MSEQAIQITYGPWCWGGGLGITFILAGWPAFAALLEGHSLYETVPGVYHGHPVRIPYKTYFEVACYSPIPLSVGVIGWLCYRGLLDRFEIQDI